MADNDKHKLRPVTGRKRAPKRADLRFSHSEGFDAALDNALKKTGWPKGEHGNVEVTFAAKINVVNPGSIVEYIVKLKPGP
jgi:hypothetical protein